MNTEVQGGALSEKDLAFVVAQAALISVRKLT